MGDQKWYVLRVISGQEKKIKTYLENEISRNKLEEYIPQVLIPSEKVYGRPREGARALPVDVPPEPRVHPLQDLFRDPLGG